MSKSSGLTRRLWNFMTKSLTRTPTTEAHLVGEDHLGNKYYEKAEDKVRGRRPRKWVETPDSNDVIPEVPIEWNAWLRNTRKNPPTQEEIDRNCVMMLRTQHRAKEIEMRDQMEKEASNVPSDGISQSISGDSKKGKFPVYDDFETVPGHKKR